MRRDRVGLTRNGMWVGRYTLTWRDPWTRTYGLALDDGRRVLFMVGLRGA